MADLVAIAFPTEAKAEEVRQRLMNMQKEYLIELADAVIAVKQPDGTVKLNQLFHPTAAGAATGGFSGFADRSHLPDAVGRGGDRRRLRCPRRGAQRCRHQRPVHEGCGANAAVRQRRALSLDPQDHGRQGAGRSQGCRRHGDAHLVRSHQGRGAARSACRRRPAAAPAIDGARLRPVQNAVQT